MIQKLDESATKVWFYNQGWRVGQIIKKYSNDLVTVKDCTGSKYRIRMVKENAWIALNNKDFKEEHKARKKRKKKDNKKKIVKKRTMKIVKKRRLKIRKRSEV